MKIPFLSILLAWRLVAAATAGEADDGTLPQAIQVTGCTLSHRLLHDEALLEYLLSDSLLTIHATTGDSTQETVQHLSPLFWQSLESFRRKLASADPTDLSFAGEILYSYLVGTVEGFISGKRRLIVIAAPPLSGLPFEALARRSLCHGSGERNCLRYLVQDFEVVYHRSVASWIISAGSGTWSSSAASDDKKFGFTGFAPAACHGRDYTGLLCASHEIKSLDSLFRRKGIHSYIKIIEEWDRDTFYRVASAGRIVHLATHAVYDGKERGPSALLFPGNDRQGGGACFTPRLLTAGEISAMSTDADLVVLNACRTAGSSPARGTPELTLPELFSQAGARNVLYTLWNVADRPAERFILDFYRALLDGKNCSAALREVKLQWIRRRETSLPFLWAVYVLTGEG